MKDAYNYCSKILGRSFTACQQKITNDKYYGINQDLRNKSIQEFETVSTYDTDDFRNPLKWFDPIVIKKGNSVIEITEEKILITL
jgi:hypothetical protein